MGRIDGYVSVEDRHQFGIEEREWLNQLIGVNLTLDDFRRIENSLNAADAGWRFRKAGPQNKAILARLDAVHRAALDLHSLACQESDERPSFEKETSVDFQAYEFLRKSYYESAPSSNEDDVAAVYAAMSAFSNIQEELLKLAERAERAKELVPDWEDNGRNPRNNISTCFFRTFERFLSVIHSHSPTALWAMSGRPSLQPLLSPSVAAF